LGAYWHPFADMAAAQDSGALVIASGDGAHVSDEQGRRYLDATAAPWYCNVGHGRVTLAEAAAAQMRTLASYTTFGDFATRPTLETRRASGCDRAGVRQQGVPDQRRIRLGRHRGEAGAAVLAGDGQARQDPRAQPPARLGSVDSFRPSGPVP